MTVQFVEGANVADFYESAEHIRIVGLACKRFFADLNYHDVVMAAGGGPARLDAGMRLQRLRNSELFPHLRRGLSMHVSMVNPHCDYANERAREERTVNRECRRDLHRGIEALKCLADDLRGSSIDDDLRIHGSLEVRALHSNPYFSYTRIRRGGQEPDIVRVGFLLLQEKGSDCPAILIDDTQALSGRALAAFQEHAVQLPSDAVFSWSSTGAVFHDHEFQQRGGYNVFFSYNHRDHLQVSRIGTDLYHNGLICWIDQSMPGGTEWETSIRRAILGSTCAVVFFGPNGLGYWQMREMQLIYERSTIGDFRVIPVVLPRRPGGRTLSAVPETPLKTFQEVHFTGDGDEALKRLENAIRSANGF